MFPLSSPLPPPHCSALFPPNTHLPPPPTNPSTVSPLLLPPPLPLPSTLMSTAPPPLEIVICKTLCLDSPYLCRGVVASLSLSSFLSVFHEVLAQTGTFSSCTEKKQHTHNKTMCATLKQQNLSPKEFCLSHAKPIFFRRLNKLSITKWKKRGEEGVKEKKKKKRIWLWFEPLKKSQHRMPQSSPMRKTNLQKKPTVTIFKSLKNVARWHDSKARRVSSVISPFWLRCSTTSRHSAQSFMSRRERRGEEGESEIWKSSGLIQSVPSAMHVTVPDLTQGFKTRLILATVKLVLFELTISQVYGGD